MIFKNTNGYRLFAFDLDGTLLDSNKELSKENLEAVLAAKSAGVEIVPSTGRTFKGLPDFIKELPCRYFILINGAFVYDREKDEVLKSFNIPLKTALDIYKELSSFPVLYDSYVDGEGFIQREFYENINEYVREEFSRYIIKALRKPVEDFYGFVRDKGMDVQKISIYSKDVSIVSDAKSHLEKLFPDVVITKSLKDNSEINHYMATKGNALCSLSEKLGIPIDKIIAIGDGTNDISMIEKAGLGIAMGNAEESVKKASSYITGHCDESGLANALIKFLKD